MPSHKRLLEPKGSKFSLLEHTFIAKKFHTLVVLVYLQ